MRLRAVPCTAPHKPDVQVEGNTVLDLESLPSCWLKNALFRRGRIRGVVLHQLTIEKPERNKFTSGGCSAPQPRNASVPPLPVPRTRGSQTLPLLHQIA